MFKSPSEAVRLLHQYKVNKNGWNWIRFVISDQDGNLCADAPIHKLQKKGFILNDDGTVSQSKSKSVSSVFQGSFH